MSPGLVDSGDLAGNIQSLLFLKVSSYDTKTSNAKLLPIVRGTKKKRNTIPT